MKQEKLGKVQFQKSSFILNPCGALEGSQSCQGFSAQWQGDGLLESYFSQ